MISETQYRKLTTILSADVVGYGRLVSTDEAGTISAFKSVLATVFRDASERYQGRIIKLMGDGILMEFLSVVDAVNFAAEVQATLGHRHADTAPDRRLAFRIGINVGDVIVDGDDIFGTGVNVAVRIEALAGAGEVLVSRTVRDQVKDIVTHRFQALGRKKIKNLPDPVEVFRLVSEEAKPQARHRDVRTGRRRKVGATLALIVAVSIALALWDRIEVPPDPQRSPVRLAAQAGRPVALAIHPFRDMSVSASVHPIAAGLSADLATDLARIAGLDVSVARVPFAAAARNAAPRPRFVLSGSVQRAGSAVRVNAQMIDRLTGVHVWAERFDGTLAEGFALQDRIVAKTVTEVRMRLTGQLVQ